MYFGLSEEQELLQHTIRSFTEGELGPQRLRDLFESGVGHDPELWKASAEIGLTGLAVDEAYGGAGLEFLDLALAFEMLGAAAVPGALFGHSLATLALRLGGSQAQRKQWLPALASGDAIGTVALGEPDGTWEADEWNLEAEGSTLRGSKCYAPLAHVADLIVVGVEGGLALVERNAAGLDIEAIDGVDRTRPAAHLHFDETPAEKLGGGLAVAQALVDAGRILLAADSFGAAWTLIHATAEYAKMREQFDTPIGQFQAVKHQLADMLAATEPARSLYWYAAYVFTHEPEERPRSACMAKAHITDVALDVARGAVELHGGIGFTWECDVHFWLKRAMWNRNYLGTPEVHRERMAQLAGW